MAAKVQYINEGFTSGEISQELQGRVSSEMYKESVAAIENMVSTVQGAAIRRPGSKFIVEASQQNAESGHRLIPYKISAARGAMIHAGPDTLAVYDQTGAVNAAGVGVEAIVNTNPRFYDQLTGWVERNYWHNASAATITYSSNVGDVSWDALRPSALLDSKSFTGSGITQEFGSGYTASLAQAITLEPSTQYELAFSASSSTPRASITWPNLLPGKVRVVEVVSATDFFPTNPAYVTNVLATLPYTLDAQAGTILFTTPAWGS